MTARTGITLGRVATWLIRLTLIEQLSSVVTDWLALVEDRPFVLPTALTSVNLGIWVAAVVVFVAWLWQARTRAERLSPATHRWERGWVIGSWVCPIVNLYLPRQIVEDVVAAGRADRMPVWMTIGRRSLELVDWWWFSLVAFYGLSIGQSLTARTDDDPGLPLAAVVLGLVALAVMVVAAMLAGRLIEAVDRSQDDLTQPWAAVGSGGAAG